MLKPSPPLSMPFSQDAEQGVIMLLLNEPNHVATVKNRLSPACFHLDQCHRIYLACLYLHERFRPCDPVTLISYLRDSEQLDAVGGSHGVMELFHSFPVRGMLDYYIEILLEKHAMRQIIEAAGALVNATRNPDTTSAQVIETAIAEFRRLEQSRLNSADMLPCRRLGTILNEVVDKAEARSRRGGGIIGLPTGNDTIDKHTGGMQDGRLWVVAGQTSEGKSSLVQNFVESACDAGATAVIYSYEMPDVECAERLLCSRGPVDIGELTVGQFTYGGQEALGRAMLEIQRWDLSLVDVDGATIEQVCRDIDLRVADLRKTRPEARFVAAIDYLQLANTAKDFGTNRERAVAHISKTAKQCAKRNRIPILIPSQLNDDGKLRESRAIGHDADVALSIRPVSQAKKAFGKKADAEPADDEREIFCGKNRGGKRNWSSRVKLQGEHFRFRQL